MYLPSYFYCSNGIKLFNDYMIKKSKYPHISSQGICAPPIPPKIPNKLSAHTINTARHNQNPTDPPRLHTEPHKNEVANVPFQQEWEEIYNRRENFLNSMFNRRKTVLENISKKNRDIYIRITNQESHYHYSRNKEEKQDKPKHTIENLTANSRLMLTLSKHALSHSNAHPNKLEPLREKQTNIRISEEGEKKIMSKQLTPIIEHGEAVSASDFKIIQSRYIKDELSFNASNKAIGVGKARGKSVGRTRLGDVFINF